MREIYVTEVAGTLKTPFDIVFVEAMCDGPISGSCTFDGKFYAFECVSENTDLDRTYRLTRVGFFGRMLRLTRKNLYDICVKKSFPYSSLEKFLFFLYFKILRFI
jgi:hypothetical protein